MVRTGKPWSIGSGWPFMATASIALRSSVRAARGVPQVQPSSDVWSTASAPSWAPARRSRSATRTPLHQALPIRSPPDLVGHAVERDPGLRTPTGEQVVVGQLQLVVDHAVDPQPPVARLDRRHHDRGVDLVEVVVRRLPRTDALEPDPRTLRDLRLRHTGQPQQPAGLLHVPAAGADHPSEAGDHDRRGGERRRPGTGTRGGSARAGWAARHPRRRRPRPPRPPRGARPGAAARSSATGRSARWRSRRRSGGTPGSTCAAGSRRRRRRWRRARRTRPRAATSCAAPGGRRTRRPPRGPPG